MGEEIALNKESIAGAVKNLREAAAGIQTRVEKPGEGVNWKHWKDTGKIWKGCRQSWTVTWNFWRKTAGE